MNPKSPTRTVAIITGSRAEFGLLRPVIDAVKKHPRLRLRLVIAGSHFLPPANTFREVHDAYPVTCHVRMQRPGKSTRLEDARATARGLTGFARVFKKVEPDWVVVLGDRIEAFAAASAASIGGIAVCHIHGGDRAEGIADEAMRHAITKLAHLHCAATKQSAKRIIAMGENRKHVHVTGSPAIDGLDRVKPLDDRAFRALGSPISLLLLHPSGLDAQTEARIAHELAVRLSVRAPVLLLAPNADPGRLAIERQWRAWTRNSSMMQYVDHLPRATFLSLLKRLAGRNHNGHVGLLVGNSSAGLIEAAALGVRTVNIGPRQSGRERAGNVIDVPLTKTTFAAPGELHSAIELAERLRVPRSHPFGDGRAGPRIADLLANTDPAPLLRKRNTY